MKNNFSSKLKYVFLALVAVVGVFSLNAAAINVSAQSIASTYSITGTGSSSQPYKISTAADLAEFATSVNNGNSYKGKYVVLTKDINLAAYSNFTPIGNNAAKYFQGNFNGQGHTISNLKINSNEEFLGLFGYVNAVKGFTIKNFVMTNVSITSSSKTNIYAGAVVGYCKLGDDSSYVCGNIEQIAVRSGNIKAVTSGNYGGCTYAGGIIGATSMTRHSGVPVSSSNPFKNTVNITFCYSKITFKNSASATSLQTGGIIGKGFAYITNCYTINSWLCGDDNEVTVNAGLLYVRYCYMVYNMGTLSEKYYYYATNSYKGYSETTLPSKVYNSFVVSGNTGANKWFLENPDNPATDGVIVLRGVANTAGSGSGNSGGNTSDGSTSGGSTGGSAGGSTSGGNTGGTSGGNTGGGSTGNTTPVITTQSLSVTYRYFDIQDSTWKTISQTTKQVALNSIFIVESQTNYSRDNLSKLNKPFFNFVKSSDNKSIMDSSLVITSEYFDLIKSGYVLYVNFLNGGTIKINNENYWIVSGQNKLFEYDGSKFNEVNLLNNAKFMPTKQGYYFLGWSTENTLKVCEFANVKEDGKYVDWRIDVPLALKAERANLEASSSFEITGFTTDLSEAVFSDNADVQLYAVWGDSCFRCYTAVYKILNGKQVLEPNLTITSSAEAYTGYLRLAVGQNYQLSLKDVLGNVVQDGNGYESVEWKVGSVSEDGVFTALTQSKYGTITNANSATSTLSGHNAETSIIAVVTPKTGIKLNINLQSEFPNSREVNYYVKNVYSEENPLPLDAFLATYGETYTIIAENIEKGYFISDANFASGAQDCIDVESDKITFMALGDDEELTLNVFVKESFFNDLVLFTAIALLIVSALIVIVLLIANIYHPKFNFEEYVEKKEE